MFSELATAGLKSCANIEIICGRIDKIPEERPCIIATGPLTTEDLLDDIADKLGIGCLYFFDAASPIVTYDSIDHGVAYRLSRYGKGEGEYINCPMTREQYEAFTVELRGAETADPHGFEDSKLFEACVPVESLARRGADTLRFGPLKPKGLPDPATGREPYAVVQLRQDDISGGLYNLVGFQTRLKFGEQRRVFSMIPGLSSAEFVRYGVMHRNAYINSQHSLDRAYALRRGGDPGLFFAGQISGVEGYAESISSGLTAGINAALRAIGAAGAANAVGGAGVAGADGAASAPGAGGTGGAFDALCAPGVIFPRETMIGALAAYISASGDAETIIHGLNAASSGKLNCEPVNGFDQKFAAGFQPMNSNFGLLPPLGGMGGGRKPKRERNALFAARSLELIREAASHIDELRMEISNGVNK
jgi:folate-dependent tRNA-U54 methylase TrmFO/GidA